MRFSRVPALMLFVLVAVLGSSSPARAWTRTVVKGARATVDVEPDATLSILLRLDVEVHAGWLHEMELARRKVRSSAPSTRFTKMAPSISLFGGEKRRGGASTASSCGTARKRTYEPSRSRGSHEHASFGRSPHGRPACTMSRSKSAHREGPRFQPRCTTHRRASTSKFPSAPIAPSSSGGGSTFHA